ncbi:MAG: hypothetical protein CL927_12490 [Deltaproteobacteria bacterium]|nr:hypothetical protein [Deltaproteobacteria bacterium]HCH62646.1 hypothetical protein [Deltaproteobacteria bacterium]
MDNLIISQGSMLMAGARPPAVPGTSAGAKAGGNKAPVVRANPAVANHIRRGNSTLLAAAKTPNYPKPAASQSRVDQGPSTFLQKVLGGHLPASWLFAGPKGR